MAKISSYPNAGTVTLSDILIGTEVGDNNATKNFSLGDVLNLFNDPAVLTGFVPYTGATNDVDLGTYELSCYSIFLTGPISLPVDGYGTAGQILTSQGSSAPTWEDPITFYSATFFHNGNQANGGITVANQALLNSTQQANGFTLGPDNRVNVENTGVYFLSVNLQLVFVGGGSSPYNVTTWFTVNDVIAPNSAFTFTTSSAQNDQTLATITDTIVLNAGDYIKVYWWSSVAAISLLATPAGTNPTRPLSPSVNFSIFNIG